MSKQIYPSINGLRAISIILVIINHLELHDHIFQSYSNIPWLSPVLTFIQDGHLGVNVFFVISGFLITSLMMQEESGTGTVSIKNFYIRRTLRIFPAYYFLLFFYLILQLCNIIKISAISWVTSITYTKYFNWDLDWYTSHAWSLSIEEHFYLFWPLIFIGSQKIRKYIALSLVMIVPFVRIYLHLYPVSWINELTIFTRIDAIAIGCVFALFKDGILKWMAPHWAKLFYASVAGLFLLEYFPDLAVRYSLGYIFVPMGATHGSIANLFVATIMMYAVFGPQRTFHKILNLKALNFIGLISYSLYLWQQPFTLESNYWVTQFPQNVFLMFFMALFSFYLIEKPFLVIKARFNERRNTARKKNQ